MLGHKGTKGLKNLYMLGSMTAKKIRALGEKIEPLYLITRSKSSNARCHLMLFSRSDDFKLIL